MSIWRRGVGLVRGAGLGLTLYGSLAFWYVLCLPFLWAPGVVRRMVQLAGRIATPTGLFFGGVRVRGEGKHHLDALGDSPYIIIANHSSNLDPLALMTYVGRWDLAFVAKADTLKRPMVGTLLEMVGWLSVDRESLVGLKRLQEQIRARQRRGWIPRMVIFPEGTRTLDGKLGKFKLGPFLLAAQMGIPILPVIIRGTFPKHPKGAFSVHAGPVRVEIKPSIVPAGPYSPLESVNVAAAMQKQAEALFAAVPDLTKVTDVPVIAVVEQTIDKPKEAT